MRGFLTDQLKQYSTNLQNQGLHRHRQVSHINSEVINFSSNDYLSLTTDPRIKKAYQKGFERYPTGSGGSMVVCGYHDAHYALEKAFAHALDVDDCLLFPSGYAANLSVTGLLARFHTHVVIDKCAHASIYDGLRLARADFSRYLHNNLDDLKLKMAKTVFNSVIMTESTFSMSGQSAPLAEIAQLGHELLVDEAHAFGLIGPQGLGGVVHHQLTQQDVPLRVIPLGKAYGASGAIVAGQRVWLDALLQSARPQIYSTAISPAMAYGLLETLDVLRCADEQRATLVELVRYFKAAVKNSPLTWRDSDSPIQQLKLGCSHRALRYGEKLRENSIFCLPMRQPTVSQQETGLRVILNYRHEPEHIDRLFKCLHECETVC